ncbi:MAG: hypothetical protein H6Q10_720 [Acidobacteria bacterium]|nr:hypothetical protein [Acidobacteriota bacterium]
MRKTPLAWGLAVAVLVSGVARAQSLGEVAKKEEERRKTVKSSGKVYTNDDLRRYPVTPTPVPAGEAEGAAAPGAPPAQRALVWSQRTAALEEMERLTQEIADQKKEIAAIEEEARQEGVPPGWLR